MIEYMDVDVDRESLELIQPLWEQLRDHHASLSTYFSEQIAKDIFENRIKNILEKNSEGKVKIILAQNTETNKIIGYCISSIDKHRQGEIDSIYIVDGFRRKGVGDVLLGRTLKWLKNEGIKNISLSVMFGNEEVFKFYERHGFYPRTYVLKYLE